MAARSTPTVIRVLELLLNYPLQWVVFGLHLNELLWWHILCSVDWDTAGPVDPLVPTSMRMCGQGMWQSLPPFLARCPPCPKTWFSSSAGTRVIVQPL